jgi:hypothetical protein
LDREFKVCRYKEVEDKLKLVLWYSKLSETISRWALVYSHGYYNFSIGMYIFQQTTERSLGWIIFAET